MQHITFEGVSFNVDFITKDMAKDFRYAHIWHDRKNRNELFDQLYSLTHPEYADDNEHVTSIESDGYSTGASERTILNEGGLCSNTKRSDASR